MSCSIFGTSTKSVIGTACFDFSSTKKYVPSEQCGCDEIVGTPVPRSAAVSFENGVTQASGNQSARGSVMPVCSLTQRARSDRVNRFASSSCFAMRPVNATGWKLIPDTVSMLSIATRTMSPI